MSVFGQPRSCPATILRAYKNGEFTDLTITCRSMTFKVHQVVVCSACDFFRKSLEFAGGKEAVEKCIDLPEDDPEMIRRLIAYLYLGDYDPGNELSLLVFGMIKQYNSTTEIAPAYHSRYRNGGFGGFTSSDKCSCLAPNTENATQPILSPKPKDQPKDYSVVEKPQNGVEVANPLTIHATMYALADKYQVDELGKAAKEKFETCLHHHIISEDFVNAVQIVYGLTPESYRGLRDAVVKAFLVHFKVDIKGIPGIEEKLDTIDELSLLLIKSWPTKTELPKPAPVSAFGGSSSAQPAPSFGGSSQPATSQPTTSNLFRTSQPARIILTPDPARPSIFGVSPLPVSGSQTSQPAASGLFGQSSQPAAGSQTSQPATPGLFGSSQPAAVRETSQPTTSSLFGSASRS
ncbi:hypothetical protein BKA66DRAFT_573270 [Pyrenochaeta sp. MPI-SDFR-AT-0127]|nr:hypothetical protein BKA66DRAFT_573270 [Pyrenochaeta sp. MPI-SDFR-AT-0127]